MFLGFQMVTPTLALYLERFSRSAGVVGAVVGAFTIAAVAVRPWVGRQLDAAGRRPVLTAGLATFAAATAAFAVAPSLVAVAVLRVVQGAGWGALTTAAGTVAADVVPAPRRAEGLGYYGMATNAAQAVAPAVGLWLAQRFGFTPLFAVAALLGLVALGLGWALGE
ncbi:MAG: MFS transporter, partial [Clostridia bacterium]|nr:MFS transporter [Clostridia bacterium]